MFRSTIEALSVPKYNRGMKRSEDPFFVITLKFLQPVVLIFEKVVPVAFYTSSKIICLF